MPTLARFNTTTSTCVSRRSWRRVVHFDRSLPSDLADALWQNPEQLLTQAEPLRQVGIRNTVRLQWGDQSFVLKHYVEPTIRHAAKQNVSRSRAFATWEVGHKLHDAGIATPRPAACIENRWGPFRGDSFLLYPYVEGQTLRKLFREDQPELPRVVKTLSQQWTAFWQRLTHLGVSLADTNLQNFIVSPAGRLWVIDLDKARFHRLNYFALRHRDRSRQQLLRSARRTSPTAEQFIRETIA